VYVEYSWGGRITHFRPGTLAAEKEAINIWKGNMSLITTISSKR
jgi:hypothetical protein